MSKILSIHTADSKKLTIALNIDGKESKIVSKTYGQKSEAALPIIDKLLNEKGLGIEQIDGIDVDLKKGSFTGVRVGASIANALGFLLKVPINNKKIGELARPVYNKIRL